MRYSKLFGKTSKTTSSDDKIISSKLLHQAGYIRESTAGRYFILPLGQRVQQKIMQIIKEEMDAAGGQEMISPILHPLELWRETNRTKTTGFELMSIKDRRDAEFALGGTAEEMFVDVVRKFQMSYRDLTFNIYQFSTKFRDELRARGGLLRVREFIMKDAYSFSTDESSFKKEYDAMAQTYRTIFQRLGLKTVMVEADNGYIGGEYCHEFVVEHPVGESRFLMTDDGSYAAHEDVAVFLKEKKNVDEQPLPLEEVEAVRGTTMKDGVTHHNRPDWQQIKDVLYVDEKGRFILAVLRGDLDVNETKLCHLTGSVTLRHATDDEIRAEIHSEPGFLSPVGIRKNISKDTELIVVGDDSLRTVVNAFGGTNTKHKDYLNINIDRDYTVDLEGDIAMAQPGFQSRNGKGALIEKRGIEVGNIFQLGYHYTNLMKGAVYDTEDGQRKPYYMGCYGIGIGRTMAAIVETHNDTNGIRWPDSIAPFMVHLVGLDLQEETVRNNAERVYADLTKVGISVLFDDRAEKRAGEKFADADLIGVPHRIIVSKKTGDQVEYKNRLEAESKMVSTADLHALVQQFPQQ